MLKADVERQIQELIEDHDLAERQDHEEMTDNGSKAQAGIPILARQYEKTHAYAICFRLSNSDSFVFVSLTLIDSSSSLQLELLRLRLS